MSDEYLKIGTAIVTLLVTLWPFVATFLTERKVARIEKVAATATRFAEMFCRDKPEYDKYTVALNEALRMGKRHRAKLHVDEWAPYLEAAVHDLKLGGGEISPKQVDRQLPIYSSTAETTTSLR